MNYRSTRDSSVCYTASQAIIKGISYDGGLFVPCRFPLLRDELASLKDLDYKSLATNIMARYLPEFETSQLKTYTDNAYDGFHKSEVVPIVELDDNINMIELFHGPTMAFKDMALQMLPQLLCGSLKIQKEENNVLILVATSGDTGKAALDGFADVEKTGICVFYPHDGVSKAQKLQMITQKGENVFVSGIYGNFDDAQSAVKVLFSDEDFNQKAKEKGYILSSANSINWGRLLPQIVYYFYGYFDLVKKGTIQMGDTANVCVPTGNFGNILAAYYAKQMGLPIGKLICASNVNNILTDFFNTGEYNINREFHKTNSPSMDILISSNLERLIYHLLDDNDKAVNELMSQLKTQGKYTVEKSVKAKMDEEFFVGYCDEEETLKTIKDVFNDQKYIMDTHTAVGYNVAKQYQAKTGDKAPILVASTASPYKFSNSVLTALGIDVSDDEFYNATQIQKATGLPIPQELLELKNAKVLHNETCEKTQMKEKILNWISEK